jgi:hypothetical protein
MQGKHQEFRFRKHQKMGADGIIKMMKEKLMQYARNTSRIGFRKHLKWVLKAL